MVLAYLMTRVLTAAVLTLANLMPVTVMAQSPIDTANISQNVEVSVPAERRVVPYTIDTSTVSNWDTLSIEGDFINISGAATGSVEVPLPTAEHPIIYVRLLKDDISKSGGGEDALVLGRKDTLEFSAENTARADLTRSLVLFGVTREEAFLAYDMFPGHPKFADLTALFTEQKGSPRDEAALEEIGTLEGEILIDVITHIRTQPVTQ